MELINLFENKMVINEDMIQPIKCLEDNLEVISATYVKYVPHVSLYNKQKAYNNITVDNMLMKIGTDVVYVIHNKTENNFLTISKDSFISLDGLHRAMIATFNAYKEHDFAIFVPLGGDLFVELSQRQFKKLSLIKSVIFGENLNMCNSDMFVEAQQSINFVTEREEHDDDDSCVEAGIIAKAYHVNGFNVIKDLCLYLYENKIKDEFISELNILLDEAEGTNVWLKMSDVFIEYHTGDKLKMSFEAFKAIYYSVVSIEGGM